MLEGSKATIWNDDSAGEERSGTGTKYGESLATGEAVGPLPLQPPSFVRGSGQRTTCPTDENGRNHLEENVGRKQRSTAIKRNPGRQAAHDGHSVACQKGAQARTSVRYVPQAKLDAEVGRLEALSQAALAGDTEALDRLRMELDNCPHIWRRLADLQYRIECRIAELVDRDDMLRLEASRKRASELRQALVGESSAMFVKLAASRVVACWTLNQLLELKLLESLGTGNDVKQLLHGERRFESAMRSFALAKRLEEQLATSQSSNRDR